MAMEEPTSSGFSDSLESRLLESAMTEVIDAGKDFPEQKIVISTLPPVLDKLQTIDRMKTFQASTFGKNILIPPRTVHSRSTENLKTRHSRLRTDDSHDPVNPLDSQEQQHQQQQQQYHHPSSVYLDVDDYNTFFGVCKDSSKEATCETKYTWEYDSDTLKALGRITKKFDSFRMRQLRASCFKDSGQEAHSKLEKEIEIGVDLRSTGNQTDRNPSRRTILEEKKTPLSPEIHPQSLVLSREEVARIEFFYSSLDCEVHVAGCMVDVLASVRGGDLGHSESPGHRWVQVWVGVPVMVFNMGNDKRKPRRLTVIVAERDTGLTLLEERVTYATEYKRLENDGLHLLKEGSAGNRSLKIRWSDWNCARVFMEKFEQLTADKKDPMWLQNGHDESAKNGRLLRKKIFKKRDIKKHETMVGRPGQIVCKKMAPSRHSEFIRKENISLPVDARIVTRVDSKDVHFRGTFAGLLPVHWKAKAVFTSIQNDDFRPRLPTN